MLAIQQDNADAVDLMLKHGAHLEQSYINADEGRRIFLHGKRPLNTPYEFIL
ncbi:hypothetical protein F893_01705 [Acinetobacter sp. CIP 102136]|nr:hypothetical protein F893_01705 [Acinetobacter sp. CIP 102136]